MNNVTHLPTGNADGIVPTLNELLGLAMKGEIVSLAVAVVYKDGDVGVISPSGDNHYKLIGAVYSLLHEMHSHKIKYDSE